MSIPSTELISNSKSCMVLHGKTWPTLPGWNVLIRGQKFFAKKLGGVKFFTKNSWG